MSVLLKIHEAREDVQVNSDIFYITLQLIFCSPVFEYKILRHNYVNNIQLFLKVSH